MWVRARQYTGRVVTVSNKSFFDEPIYNYCRGFDYIWEEIGILLTYTTDWERGKAILLEEGGEATRDRGRVLVVVQDLSEGRRVEANQQRFLANAAHELRTPLTATVGAAELLLNEEKKTPNCDVAS